MHPSTIAERRLALQSSARPDDKQHSFYHRRVISNQEGLNNAAYPRR